MIFTQQNKIYVPKFGYAELGIYSNLWFQNLIMQEHLLNRLCNGALILI
jgi:hypothetical protein